MHSTSTMDSHSENIPGRVADDGDITGAQEFLVEAGFRHGLNKLQKASAFAAKTRVDMGSSTSAQLPICSNGPCMPRRIAEPMKACRARQVLEGALRFRNASVPRKPFSHSSFPGAVKSFLRLWI